MTESRIRWENVVVVALIFIGGSIAATNDALNHREEITSAINSAFTISDGPVVVYDSFENTIVTNSYSLISVACLIALVFFISIAMFSIRCCA
jgi:hypothetical protein